MSVGEAVVFGLAFAYYVWLLRAVLGLRDEVEDLRDRLETLVFFTEGDGR